jgi:hypothetical protein
MHIKDRWKVWRHMASLGWKGFKTRVTGNCCVIPKQTSDTPWIVMVLLANWQTVSLKVNSFPSNWMLSSVTVFAEFLCKTSVIWQFNPLDALTHRLRWLKLLPSHRCLHIINYAPSNVICLALNEPKTIWEGAAVACLKELRCPSLIIYILRYFSCRIAG